MTAANADPGRIVTLDILRGVAVMGILAMNATGFAMPEVAYYNPAAYGGAAGFDLAAWAFNFVFFDGKMRGLFALLFGASMLLVIERAEANGENAASVHVRRMLVLLLFGAFHFYVIWWGDILLHYSLIGLVAFFFHRAGTRALILWILLLVAIDWESVIAFGRYATNLSAAAAAPDARQAAIDGWQAVQAGFAPLSPDALAKDIALHRGDPIALLAHRWATQAWLPIEFLGFGGPETLALMLMGMLGLRTGFLTGSWSSTAYLRVALCGTLMGAAGFAVLAAYMIRSGFAPHAVILGSVSWTVPFRLMMIAGYAASIILLARKGGAMVERIAAAGRTAFTNYLGTSLLLTVLFYGHGLGLYGSFSRAGLWPLVLAMWVLMLLWSKPWLDRYRYGPLEWLWRSLARGRIQPFRNGIAKDQMRPNS